MLDTKSQREINIIDPTAIAVTGKRRVAAYCRVSSSSDEQLDSFAAQMDYYGKLIAEYDDWELVDIYADEGISALGMTKRDEFNRLMRDARKGKIDHIITKSISRFSRNTKDCLESVRALRAIGVSIAFEKENINTAEMGGEMFLAMFSGAAQQESISISGNMRWSYVRRMKSGDFITCKAPFGYRLVDGTLEVDETEAEMVRHIFEGYLQGKSRRELAAETQRSGFVTRNGGKVWQVSAITYILKNERYQGDAVLQKRFSTDTLPFQKKRNNGEKDKFYVQNSHPPIIDCAMFDTAQEIMKKRTVPPSGPRQQYPLSRRMKCAECGATYRRTKVNSGIQWVCRRHYEKGNAECTAKAVPEQEIYRAFVRMYNKLRPAVQHILGTMLEQLYSLRSVQNQNNTKVAEVNREIANLTEQNHVMNDLKVKNLIDSAFFIAQTNELSHKIRRLRTEKSRLMESDDDDELLTGTRNLLDFFEDSPERLTEFDTEAFEQIVNKIIVDSNEKIRFQLVNGLELTEKIERVKR